MPRVIDLFSGSGGLTLGFEQSGFEIVSAFENWKPAIDTYKRNFSHPITEIDLSSPIAVDVLSEFDFDGIIGGPPCQDFSIAGKRDVEGRRANLTRSFGEFVAKLRPSFFVMENVYSIVGTSVIEEVLESLANAGYGVSRVVLDASFFGVPQMRKRFFAVGVLGAREAFLKSALEMPRVCARTTVGAYFGHLIDTQFYYAHPRSYKRRGVFSIDEPSATIRGVNRPMPPNYKFHPADKSFQRDQIRALTSTERASIQTFPPTFEFLGSNSQIEQQIGNAVPVKLAAHVATVLKSGI